MDLVEVIYGITKLFPKEELYGLASQMRRAAVSIPSNISEGFARYHNKEYKRFLYISLGSLAELKTQLLIAQRLGYSGGIDVGKTIDEMDVISKMTMSLVKKLKDK